MALIDRLRQETGPMHEELDKAMVPRIHNIQSKEQYSQLLQAFYGFFKPVYEEIEKHLDTSLLPDYAERRKPHHILENLLQLGYNFPEEKKADNLPLITNNASAFGALYVMEGSTLGGLMIKKMIAAQTGLPDDMISFFGGYGKATRQRWDVFVSALNSMAQTEDDEKSAVIAAAETFSSFKSWLDSVYF